MKRERFACTFQKDGSLRKMFLGCKTGKRLEEDLHLKGTKEKNLIVSAVNGRKGRLGAYSQEETYLKFNPARGKTKAISATLYCAFPSSLAHLPSHLQCRFI